MLTADPDLARRFIAAHPPPGRLLLCGEKCPLPDALDRRHRVGWKDLGDALDSAVSESALPPEAVNRDAIEQWLIALRLAEIQS